MGLAGVQGVLVSGAPIGLPETVTGGLTMTATRGSWALSGRR
jgi:hypothetical protein